MTIDSGASAASTMAAMVASCFGLVWFGAWREGKGREGRGKKDGEGGSGIDPDCDLTVVRATRSCRRCGSDGVERAHLLRWFGCLGLRVGKGACHEDEERRVLLVSRGRKLPRTQRKRLQVHVLPESVDHDAQLNKRRRGVFLLPAGAGTLSPSTLGAVRAHAGAAVLAIKTLGTDHGATSIDRSIACYIQQYCLTMSLMMPSVNTQRTWYF